MQRMFPTCSGPQGSSPKSPRSLNEALESCCTRNVTFWSRPKHPHRTQWISRKNGKLLPPKCITASLFIIFSRRQQWQFPGVFRNCKTALCVEFELSVLPKGNFHDSRPGALLGRNRAIICPSVSAPTTFLLKRGNCTVAYKSYILHCT